MDNIHFGATVRFKSKDSEGNPVDDALGVFIGYDPEQPGWGIVSPNEDPGKWFSIPIDDLEAVKD